MLHELSWQHWRSDITVMLHDCFSAVTWWIKVDSILYFNHLNSCILYFAPNSQSNCKKSIWDTYLQSNLYFVIEIHFKVVDPTLLYGHLDGRVAGLTKTWWDNTIQYNARFVWRHYTNRPGAPYNSNNKSVCAIKQNGFKPLLECTVFVSVISCKSAGRLFQAAADQSTGNHVRQTWCVFSAGHSQLCRTIWVCTYSRMKRSWRHSYSNIAEPGRCVCSGWEGIICRPTRFVFRPRQCSCLSAGLTWSRVDRAIITRAAVFIARWSGWMVDRGRPDKSELQ